MNTPIIRPERPGDEDAITHVTEQAFRSAPHSDRTEHYVVRALRDAAQLAITFNGPVPGGTVSYHEAFKATA